MAWILLSFENAQRAELAFVGNELSHNSNEREGWKEENYFNPKTKATEEERDRETFVIAVYEVHGRGNSNLH
jgi:hypothetical protein